MSTPEALRKIYLFKECTNAELIKIGNLTQKVNFEPGAIIFHKGDAGNALYLIREGEVEVLSPKAEGDDTQNVVAVLGAGELFGEMAMVEGEPRSATIRARTNVHMLRIKKEYFEDLMSKDHAIAFKIYRRLTMILSHRLRDTTERLGIANDIIRMTSER